MNDIHDFLRNAKDKNLCERGARIWEHCGSNKALVDYALSAWGVEYLANAIFAGWGISPESIRDDFPQFINGKYVREKDGFTSAMFCFPETDVIEIATTAAIIINHNGKVIVNRPCELHIVNSKVEVIGDGRGVAYLYNSEITNNATASVVVKEDRRN